MSKWSEGYYKAAIIGGSEISIEELVEFSIASKMRSYMGIISKSANSYSVVNRINELTTPASFIRFEGNTKEYWDGYNAALVDLESCDANVVKMYQVKYFNMYKKDIERSLQGFIRRNAARVKNSNSDFEKDNAGKMLFALNAIEIQLSGLTLQDLLS